MDEAYDILEAEDSATFVQYYATLDSTENGEVDPESLFSVRGRNEETVYVVGDDNEFSYKLNLTALTPEGEYEYNVKTTKTVTTFYMKETYDGEYRKLNDSELSTYVEVIGSTSTYKFTEGENGATGKFFKLEIRPYYLKETQLSNLSRYTKTIEFKVVDGYNVTEAKQLGILYNNKDQSHYEHDEDPNNYFKFYDDWTNEILTPSGITRKDDVRGIILHNDITITGADIPTRYLGKRVNVTERNDDGELTNLEAVYVDDEGEEWILVDDVDAVIDVANGHTGACDGTNIYCHYVEEGQPFTIYGNYFTLNAKLPTVDTGILPSYGSTTSLFKFVSTYSELESDSQTLGGSGATQQVKDQVNNNAVASSKNAIVNIYNLNTKGNAARTDSTNKDANKDSAGMGGLIFFKSCATTVNVYNSIVKAYLVNFYLEKRLSNINLTNVKSYDAYQSIVYGYQGGNLNIVKSQLKRAGGPVMLLAANYETAAERHGFYITIDDQSKLESWVTGLEPWFAVNGEKVVNSAKDLKAQENIFKKTFGIDTSFAKIVKIQTDENSPESEAQVVNAIITNVYTGDAMGGYAPVIAKVTIDDKVVLDTIGMDILECNAEGSTTKDFVCKRLLQDYSQVFATAKGGAISSVVSDEDPADLINEETFIPDLSNLLSPNLPNTEETRIIKEMIELGFIDGDVNEDLTVPSDNTLAILGQIDEDTVTEYVMAKFLQSLSLEANQNSYLGVYVPGMSMVVGYFSTLAA